MRQPQSRDGLGRSRSRRGVTLIEMLTVVALLVIMMTILVQIFQSATGAMSLSRTTSEMDVTLRQVESILRTDLAGVTAKMTPPNDPKDQRGYFEYGENAPADAQGEDTDDTLGFTTKAPDGSFFTGRQMIYKSNYSAATAGKGSGTTTVLVPITSQVAEVIYFLRNGNLYRRVLLVAPERANSIVIGTGAGGSFSTNLFGAPMFASWQGLNDISCHHNNVPNGGFGPPIPNTLGDLTNRENRAFRPRFINDYLGGGIPLNGLPGRLPDGIADDYNGDGLPDYYPTLYTDGVGHGSAPNLWTLNQAPYGFTRLNPSSYSVYAFPFIYPGMYTLPSGYTAGPIRGVGSNLGWSHCLAPAPTAVALANGTTADRYLSNHSPLLVGDNLPSPGANQTWWGYPTWRETMTGYAVSTVGTSAGGGSSTTPTGWGDPIISVATLPNTQPLGLRPASPAAALASNNPNLLPTISTAAAPLPFTDLTAGSPSFVANPSNPRRVWEDDLLLGGVRSFDVKAYDPNAPLYSSPINGLFSAGYQDLGYGSAYFELTGKTTNPSNGYNYVGGPNGPMTVSSTTDQVAVPWQTTNPRQLRYGFVSHEPVGLGHEGRIPPLRSDFRMHARRPYLLDTNNNSYPYNIGDDSAGVIRLTRVWDSWSTDYTNAPDTDVYLTNYQAGLPAVYPSFPPPYPTALRGIQIQIRLADARGERTKAITIRHDFTDKLN